MSETTVSDATAPRPAWLKRRTPSGLRWSTMARVALRMALHDRQKTFGAILGIAFAYLLIGQNVCTSDHYISQATAYIDNAGADLWIGAPATRSVFASGTLIPAEALHRARVIPDVAWAEPMVRGSAWVRLPDGGTRGILLIGVAAPNFRGGPFNLMKGNTGALLRPNAIIIDDVEREKLGGVNLGDTVEVSQHRARVAGFTWGLLTLFGPYAFAEYDFARTVLEIDADRLSFVLVGVRPGADLRRVKAEIIRRVPDATIMTTPEFHAVTRDYVLFDAGIIGVLAMGIFIGLTVGLAIVTLSMLSSVQQNIREFGTLKAIGATNADLRRVVLIQALGYSLAGSVIGGMILCELAWAVRSPRLILMVNPLMLVALVPLVSLIALAAATLAIRRVQRIEPASVFQ